MVCVCHAFASVHCCLVMACWERADILTLVCAVELGLPVGFLLLQYSVLFTVESLSLLYLLVIS